jgi:hypothetical protein
MGSLRASAAEFKLTMRKGVGGPGSISSAAIRDAEPAQPSPGPGRSLPGAAAPALQSSASARPFLRALAALSTPASGLKIPVSLVRFRVQALSSRPTSWPRLNASSRGASCFRGARRCGAGGPAASSSAGATARIRPNPHGVVTPALQSVEPVDSLESAHSSEGEVTSAGRWTRGLKDLGSPENQAQCRQSTGRRSRPAASPPLRAARARRRQVGRAERRRHRDRSSLLVPPPSATSSAGRARFT